MNNQLSLCFQDTIDGTPPNLWGMNTLVLLVLQKTAGPEGIKFLNIY